MLQERRSKLALVVLTALCVVGAGGCALNVDLTSSPDSVDIGEPVTFDVSLTNQSTCPVGGATALLFPFVPKDHFIRHIEDEELREFLSGLTDAFCSGEEVEVPGGAEADCNFAEGSLICTIRGLEGRFPQASQANIPVTAGGGDEVTCETDGGTITCRIPASAVAAAEAAAQEAAGEEPEEGILNDLICVPAGPVGVCVARRLLPGEQTMGQLQLAPQRAGILRNWIVAYPQVRGGVCRTGLLRRVPCDDDTDCGGMTPDCGTGICVGGTRDGYGCDSVSDCPGTDTACTPCAPTGGDELIPGLECTTTFATFTAPAPAMSPWALAGAVVLLLGISTLALRRRGRQGNP